MYVDVANGERMKVLLINKTLYPSGGDAVCTMATGDLLKARGHDVHYWGMSHPRNAPHAYEAHFVPHVDLTAKMSIGKKARTLANLIYSAPAKRSLGRVLDDFRPDVVHVNNIHHHLSPSVFDAIDKRGCPIVMTLHDYKVVCPCYYLRRPNGVICQRCRRGRFYHCALHRCTRGSLSKSLVNTLEMYIHRALMRIYDRVDVFLSPSRFLKSKVQEMGFRKEIQHLPHFIDTSHCDLELRRPLRRLACFGRLSPEKGLVTLLDAAIGVDLEVRVIGDGPLRQHLAEQIARKAISNVVLTGFKSGRGLHDEIHDAMATVVPSEWYEVFGRTIVESFALGKPVIASRIGAIPELVRDGQTGWTFTPGDVADLREKLLRIERYPDQAARMGQAARSFVEAHHGPCGHYDGLMTAYEKARTNRSGGNRRSW